MPDVLPGTVGHVVLVRRAGILAVWQASATGHPTGAWLFPAAGPDGEPAAVRVLALTHRRLVVAPPGERVPDLVDELTALAGLPARRHAAAGLPELAAEAGDRAAAAAGDPAGLAAAVDLARPAAATGAATAGEAAAGEALLTVRVLGRLAARWADRAPTPLPPRWWGLLRTAAGELRVPGAGDG
jgi:hypothetical protein